MNILFCLMMAGSDLEGQIKRTNHLFDHSLRPQVLTVIFAGKDEQAIKIIQERYCAPRVAPPIIALETAIAKIATSISQITQWFKKYQVRLSANQWAAAKKTAECFNQKLLSLNPEALAEQHKAEEDARRQEEARKRREAEVKRKADEDAAARKKLEEAAAAKRKQQQAEQARKLKEEEDRLQKEQQQRDAARQKPSPKPAAVATPQPAPRPDGVYIPTKTLEDATFTGQGEDGTVDVYGKVCGSPPPQARTSPGDVGLPSPASPQSPAKDPNVKKWQGMAGLFKKKP